MGQLEIKNLTLNLDGKNILNDLSLDFWEGHIHAVVGQNGAGKSTLAHTIMGLSGYRHFEGEILFEGQSLKDLTIDERARLGITLAWQEPARFEGIRVQDFIMASAKVKTLDTVKEELNLVGLSPEKYMMRKVDKTLSGGERKRIELASIAAMQPKVVIMDEPDSGVDIDAINNIFAVLEKLKDMGTTIVLITHSTEVLKKADHAFLLCDGALRDKGTVDKMIAYFEGKCIPCTENYAKWEYNHG